MIRCSLFALKAAKKVVTKRSVPPQKVPAPSKPARVNRRNRHMMATVLKKETMLSSVTNSPFSTRCQKQLHAFAAEHGFRSRYWITQAQAQRTCGAVVLPGSVPATIHLHVEKVVPVKALSKADQRRVLDEHPPFFGSGVGILSERKKWQAVTAERLIRLLNKAEEERALFIDVNVAKELALPFKEKSVVDIKSASFVQVYNAEQLDDPYKGEPPKGLAVNAVTGKRLGQPAHDILLGVGIMRGYTSPMWISKAQMKYLNLDLQKGKEMEIVPAPDMTGLVVSLSMVPPKCREELLRELKQSHPHAFGADVFFLYGPHGWEVMRSRVLVQNMGALNDPNYPFHFVNLRNLRLLKPHYADFVTVFERSKKPLGAAGIMKREAMMAKAKEEADAAAAAGAALSRPHSKKKIQNNLNATRIVVQGSESTKKLYFFAEDCTLRWFYNASCMEKPYLAMPTTRPIAIFNGRLIGRRDERILRAFSLKNKLSSPVWVTLSIARRLGVHIPPRHQKKFVTIGAAAGEGNADEGTEAADGFYNIDDFAKKEEILSLFPKASKRVHFLLDTKWRPVLGKQRQEFLSSLQRPTPLWITVSECLMSGFEPKLGAKMMKFPGKVNKDNSGAKLYNSEHTSDPVRVIGLASVFTRPQGLNVQGG